MITLITFTIPTTFNLLYKFSFKPNLIQNQVRKPSTQQHFFFNNKTEYNIDNGYECIGKLEDEICQVGHSVYKVQISLAYGYFIWFSLFLIKTKNIIDKDYRCEVEKMIGEDELKTILHQHNTAIYSNYTDERQIRIKEKLLSCYTAYTNDNEKVMNEIYMLQVRKVEL